MANFQSVAADLFPNILRWKTFQVRLLRINALRAEWKTDRQPPTEPGENEIIVAFLDELCTARLSGNRLVEGPARVNQTWLCSSRVEHGAARKKPATVYRHHAGR
jgi:hypothetical protein